MKNILIINGHPDVESYNYALANAYSTGAKTSSASVNQINIAQLSFNPNLAHGYRQRTELEPDLQDAIEKIKKADHLVWVFPMWWYSVPAIMKGFIDRTFLPGITYQPIAGKPFPKKLLKGKTARLIITADSPKWYNTLYMKNPVLNQFKKGTLQFCGVGKVKVTHIAIIKNSTEVFRKNWLSKIETLGKQLK
ncbi:NAD(P)H-dependent oxidoreductase [Neptunitalea lumnitzerae]|uniref:NAD(P)H dehydrogenase (Quinone) n=1 Tax=Neptunitalea lumnitzerae TaxID=2965509 RepID=A0ABQ5MMW2_9FLAO|nr:NAD(P)H-dependent oxidoreductase [Neptunitalea sp. Y10]GLB50307.1 NAD(P)H dehydrogenase (quinone) [Neptunitalea sp. Y10]